MAGYANRFLRLSFPELSEPDDEIWITLRNPRTVSYEELRPKNVAYDANGNALDYEQFRKAMFDVYAKLVVDGHAYDSTDAGADQPLLAFPLAGETYAKLPSEIQDKVVAELEARRNPTKTPATSSS